MSLSDKEIISNLISLSSIIDFFKINKLEIKDLIFQNTDFNIYKNDLLFFQKLLKTEPNENKIVIKNSNIFFKDQNDEIHTPIPDSFLDGITRRTVIDIAQSKGIKVNQRKIAPAELSNFVGCFLTGTAAEVTPVSCIGDNQFKVCETIIDLNESYQTLVRKNK